MVTGIGTVESQLVKVQFALKTVVAVVPFLVSMYLLYWLDSSGTWDAETAYRDFMTLGVLIVGMSLAFYSLSYVLRRR